MKEVLLILSDKAPRTRSRMRYRSLWNWLTELRSSNRIQ